MHVATVYFVVKTCGKKFSDYVCSTPLADTDGSIYWYQRSIGVTYVLFAFGLCFLIVNILTEGIWPASLVCALTASILEGLFDEGCTDPFIRTTIAPIDVSVSYQWLFVVYVSAVLWCVATMAALLMLNDPHLRAESVYKCICILASNSETAVAAAVQHWKTNRLGLTVSDVADFSQARKHRVPIWRRVLFYVFHLPILFLASLPAIGYVRSCLE